MSQVRPVPPRSTRIAVPLTAAPPGWNPDFNSADLPPRYRRHFRAA